MRSLFVIIAVLISQAISYDYSQDMVDSFMTNCQQRSSKKYCRCMIDYLQENYSSSKVDAMGARAANGSMTQGDIQIMQETAKECGGSFSQNPVEPNSRSSSGYDHLASECKRQEKRIKDCNATALKMRDGISKQNVENSCGQMEMLYNTQCLSR